MFVELKLLAAAVVLGLIHLGWAGAASTGQRGPAWNLGNRENAPPLTGLAHRLDRAFANYRESFPFFAALVIVAFLGGRAGGLATWGEWIWLGARIVYLPVYAAGIKGLRSAVWVVSLIGLLMILSALFA